MGRGGVRRIALLAVGAGLIGLAPGGAARAAARDDINGVWVVQPGFRLTDKLQPPPQLTPAAEAARQRLAEANAEGYTRAVSNMLCQGAGGPAMFQNQSPFEVFTGFGRISFVFENEYQVQPRTIYLRQASQPQHIFPSYNGHSIGHWEGEVLVVDTVGFNGRASHRGNWLGGIPRSEKAHVTERFSLSADGKVLSDQITTDDPPTFAKPWTTTLKFDRQSDDTERFEVTCEVDLDAFRATDLESIKDADPEAARLLDPDQRDSDPALKIHAAATAPGSAK